MKKIAIFLPNDSLGGAEQYLKMVAKKYSEDHLVKVFFFYNSNSENWKDLNRNVEFQSFSYKSEKIGAIVFFLLQLFLIKKHKFDYIFTSHVYVNGLIGFLIKIKCLKKDYFVARESTLIFTRYKGLKLLTYKIFYHIGYSKINLLICQSQLMKEQIQLNLKSLASKIKIAFISNPIDMNLLEQDYTKEANEIKNNFQDFIVAAGRLITEKGFDILIESFVLIKETKPNLKLLIIGEGFERDNLNLLIKSKNLNDSVFLPGYKKNILPYFKAAKVCVVSSRIEGFPNVLLQMMSQNENVVSTRCAGGIEDLKGVVTANTNDIDSLKKSILSVLEVNSNNKVLFEKELNSRSIDNFIQKINFELYTNTI